MFMDARIGKIIVGLALGLPLCLGLSPPAVANNVSNLTEDERNTIQVANAASPFVVYVHNIQKVVDFFYNTHEVQAGTGTGFIWDDKGHVVTNFHVIRDSSKVSVLIRDGKMVPAKVVGADPNKDVAVLKLESTKDLPMIKQSPALGVADSSKLIVGQKTIAIGNPFGLDRTVTTGVISAVGRQVPGVAGVTIRDMIQTDASINPGNSGGPLLNSAGELIGMNTVIYSRTGSSAGIGFAVPSNTIRRTVEQIIKNGRVIQPGIGFQRIDDSIAAQLGVKGVIVAEVIKGTPAAKAGLRGTSRSSYGQIHLGDVIVEVEGEKVENYDDLYTILEKRKIGDEVEIGYLREGRKRRAKIKLVDLQSSH